MYYRVKILILFITLIRPSISYDEVKTSKQMQTTTSEYSLYEAQKESDENNEKSQLDEALKPDQIIIRSNGKPGNVLQQILAALKNSGCPKAKDLTLNELKAWMERPRSQRAVMGVQKVSVQERNAVIYDHNNKRASVSPQAANMLKMRWNTKLAKLAAEYANKCKYAHNDNRKVDGFDYVGENIYIRSDYLSIKKALLAATQSWHDEVKDYSYADSSCAKDKMCGHYTQVVWAESEALGCAVANCKNVKGSSKTYKSAQLVVCNYGPGGNREGQKPYIAGKPRSKCPDGKVCV